MPPQSPVHARRSHTSTWLPPKSPIRYNAPRLLSPSFCGDPISTTYQPKCRGQPLPWTRAIRPSQDGGRRARHRRHARFRVWPLSKLGSGARLRHRRRRFGGASNKARPTRPAGVCPDGRPVTRAFLLPGRTQLGVVSAGPNKSPGGFSAMPATLSPSAPGTAGLSRALRPPGTEPEGRGLRRPP